jgi:acetyl esterase
LHWHISAMSFFNVSNRATFSRIFGDALFAPAGQQALRRHLVEMILGLALKPDQRRRRKRDQAGDGLSN